jgi:phosphoenolpyruvate-protein kinase (PTS system EI component)
MKMSVNKSITPAVLKEDEERIDRKCSACETKERKEEEEYFSQGVDRIAQQMMTAQLKAQRGLSVTQAAIFRLHTLFRIQ